MNCRRMNFTFVRSASSRIFALRSAPPGSAAGDFGSAMRVRAPGGDGPAGWAAPASDVSDPGNGPSLHYGGTYGIRENDGAVGGGGPGRRGRAVRRRLPGGRPGTPGDHRAGRGRPRPHHRRRRAGRRQGAAAAASSSARCGRDDGPGFDVFGMGGSRVGMVVRDVETADVAKEKLAGTAGAVVTEVVKDSAAAEGRRQDRRRRDVVRRRARPQRPAARAAGRGDAGRPHRQGRPAARRRAGHAGRHARSARR